MMKLQDLTLKEFLEKTAGNDALPAGGSSAAFIAAIAAALTEMVANVTIGKKQYVIVEDRMREIATEMSANRAYLVNSIDRDAVAYQQLIDAYRLPKETDIEIDLRNKSIEDATKNACLVPMEMAERAYNLLDTMIETMQIGNKHATTDALVGLIACRSAILATLLNVRTNLGGISDKTFVVEMQTKCDSMERATLQKEVQSIAWLKATL